MVKYLKGLLGRILISIVVVATLLTVVDKILYLSERERNEWSKETKLINLMINDKLQNINWHSDEIIYKMKDDGYLPAKGYKKRILVIGDSVIWGWGASNANHLWWKQLDRLLHENGYENIEVVAAGISGYSTKDQLDYILKREKVMEEIDPDLIIIDYFENDPEERDQNDNLIIDYIKDNDIFNTSNNLLIKLFRKNFPNLYSKMGAAIISRYEYNEKFQEKYGNSYTVWKEKIISGIFKENYQNVLIELKNYITEELKVPFFYVPISTFPEYNVNYSTATQIFNLLNISYYDFMPNFKEKYPNAEYSFKDWGINPGDGHPSVKSNQFYAEEVFEVLEQDYPSIIGKKEEKVNINLDINDWMPYSLKPTLVNDATYEIRYPAKNEKNSFLTLPIHKDYVKLNLRFPIQIKSIEINSENIESIKLYTNSINEKLGYDDQVMKSLGEKKDNFIWNLDGNEKITSINISAVIKNNKSTNMYIRFEY